NYDHWAVYVGNGKLLRWGPPSWMAAPPPGPPSLPDVLTHSGIVRKQLVTDVAAGRPYKVNNKYDKRCAPRKPKKIVKSAENEVGDRKDYSTASYNCEHFATMMRYGQPFIICVLGSGLFTNCVILYGGKMHSCMS
uniref:LRAT domain-containing protein n=1 Tax=Leptobrachium leishanense TaxID=445787 RepID=A0A8C5QPV7_9ANUR